MRPLQLANATRRMAAPAEWDHARDGICHTLEICDQNGWMVSAWKPTEAEIRRLVQGQPIVLAIQGVVHPVVSLSVPSENAEAG